MLTRILDASRINMDDPHIKYELEADLRRMDFIRHEDAPKDAEACRVIVEPSSITYSQILHRFRFEIQYGKYDNGRFVALGDAQKTQSEALPMI
jgi:hypothetical protein